MKAPILLLSLLLVACVGERTENNTQTPDTSTSETSNTTCGGSICGAGQVCVNDSCLCENSGGGFDPCGVGTSCCPGIGCVDLQGDSNFCGSCTNSCGSEQTCAAGKCEGSCGDTETDCSGVCVDTTIDVNNCGGCDLVCNGTCNANGCDGTTGCEDPLRACTEADGTTICVNLSSDANHCGVCNQPCDTGVCRDGTCVDGGDCSDGLRLLGHTPSHGQTGGGSELFLSFSCPVDAQTVQDGLRVYGDISGPLSILSAETAADGTTVRMEEPHPGERVRVVAMDTITSSNGMSLMPFQWEFYERSGPPPNPNPLNLEPWAEIFPANGGPAQYEYVPKASFARLDGSLYIAKLSGGTTGSLDSGLALYRTGPAGGTELMYQERNSFTTFCQGDFDNDGSLDFFILTRDGVSEGFWSFDGSTLNQFYNTGREGHLRCAEADFNNDGHLDIFLLGGPSSGIGGVALLLGNEAHGLDEVPVNGIDGSQMYRSITTGDIDGDGDVDVILGGTAGASSVVLRNEGSQGGGAGPDFTYEDVFLGNANNETYDMKLADLDQDGALDLVLAGQALSIVRNRDGNFDSNAENLGTTPFVRIEFADLGGDGFLDILGISPERNPVLFTSEANGSSFSEQELNTGSPEPATAAMIGDPSGDGVLDIGLFFAGNIDYIFIQ